MANDDLTIMNTSKDPRAIKVAATSVAAGTSAEEHAKLGDLLVTADFLNRMDPPAEKVASYVNLRLARVVQTLMDNRRASTDGVLVKLTAATSYQDNLFRMLLLIRALSVVRPSPPQAIAYWDRWSRPGSSVSLDVMEAVCINQSKPAMDLAERKYLDLKHEMEVKRAWLRQVILQRRNDLPLLECCDRVLKANPPSELQVAIIEVLFDYRPNEWYRDCSPPVPPNRAILTKDARAVLVGIGQLALDKVQLPAALRLNVEATMKVLNRS